MTASIFVRVALWLHRGKIRRIYAEAWAAHSKAVKAGDTRRINATRRTLSGAMTLKLMAGA
jgi:hypothetical protein